MQSVVRTIANDWSGRMQPGGHVECNFALSESKVLWPRCSPWIKRLMGDCCQSPLSALAPETDPKPLDTDNVISVFLRYS